MTKISNLYSLTNYITADSNGNIGIGTTSPSSPLTIGRVNSGSEGGQIDLCRSSDNANAWGIDVFGSTSTPSLRFVDNIASATRMAIDGTGKVGIGTTSPGEKFWTNLATNVNFAVGGTTRARLLGVNDANNNFCDLSVEGSNVLFHSAGSEKMRITTSGTTRFLQNGVGSYSIIGTVAPNNTGNRYLHLRISTVGGMMFWVKVMGYTYSTGLSEGMCSGYIYGSTGALFNGFYSGSIVTAHFNTDTNYAEIVLDTLNSGTSNRFGSYTFFGGNDNLAAPVPLEIVSYVWNSSTARYY